MRLLIKPGHLIFIKVVIHLSALLPFIFTFYQAATDQLDGDPVESILHFTGIGALNLLLISLFVSPLAKVFKAGQLVKTRRLLGLYSFFYALCHFLSFILFELQLEWLLVFSEIIQRPYITVGFVALGILASLAMTSTRWAQKQLGVHWQKLHNWVYLAALLIALHYIWSVKSDMLQPLIYWMILVFLLYQRKHKVSRWLKNR